MSEHSRNGNTNNAASREKVFAKENDTQTKSKRKIRRRKQQMRISTGESKAAEQLRKCSFRWGYLVKSCKRKDEKKESTKRMIQLEMKISVSNVEEKNPKQNCDT